jgi:hypothetical protein
MGIKRFFSHYGFITAMAIILAAAVYVRVKNHNETVQHLADALAIAAFLGLTVDPYLKSRLSREIAKDVAPLIFTHGTPGEIAKEILYFREVSLVRRDVELFYKIEILRDNLLVIETEMRYTVLNYADAVQEFVHLAQILQDKYRDVEASRIVEVGAEGADLLPSRGSKKPPYRFVDGAVPLLSSAPPLFKNKMMVKSNQVRQDNRCWWKTREVTDDRDSDVVFFPQPIVGLTVRVTSKPRDLAVNVYFGHRRSDDVKAGPSAQDPTEWKLDAAFPPFGSLTVTWEPKNFTKPSRKEQKPS